MDKNEIQNYLNEKFPELKFTVRQDIREPQGYITGFRTDVQTSFYLWPKFDDEAKHELLYRLEEMLYLKLGLLNKAVDDVREIRRELT